MKEFNKALKQIENVYNLNLEIGKELFEQKRYEYSDIFIINENEMNNKIEFIKNILTIKNNELNVKDKEILKEMLEKDHMTNFQIIFLTNTKGKKASVHTSPIHIEGQAFKS